MKPSCPERLSSRPIRPVFREVPAVEFGHDAIARHVPDEFNLPANALWSTEPRRGMGIRCERGQLWVTQAGDAQDVVLLTGETFVPAAKGRVVVQALTDARVRIADGTPRT
jgi:hypothetical protein